MPDDTPHSRALGYMRMQLDFLCTPMLARMEGPAPAWLATDEGQQYMQAWSRGDFDGAFRIFDEASATNFRILMDTMFDDLPTTPQEEQHHGES